jgi:hypothetical protein
MQICSNKSKAQAIFIHTIVNVIFKYMLQVKNTHDLSNKNVDVPSHIKAHYGCYETTKNDSLYIHILLWFNDFLNSNTFIQTLHDELFGQNMINYLNGIITHNIN